MTAVQDFERIIQRKPTTTAIALELFDALDPVDIEFMLGRWRGDEFPTGHVMDGSLKFFNWYGKEFCDAETVHPLLFIDQHQHLFRVDPRRLMVEFSIHYPVPRHPAVKALFLALRPLLETHQSKARLRMLESRGQVSATMVYDHLPINDTFKKVDENTLLGLMDMKGMTQPFFFVLRRDPHSP